MEEDEEHLKRSVARSVGCVISIKEVSSSIVRPSVSPSTSTFDPKGMERIENPSVAGRLRNFPNRSDEFCFFVRSLRQLLHRGNWRDARINNHHTCHHSSKLGRGRG